MLVVLLLLLKKEVASMKRELLDNGNIWQKNDGRWRRALDRSGALQG